MEMLRINLITALTLAIERQRVIEQGKPFNPARDSALIQGWEQIKEALERGEHVVIVDEPWFQRKGS